MSRPPARPEHAAPRHAPRALRSRTSIRRTSPSRCSSHRELLVAIDSVFLRSVGAARSPSCLTDSLRPAIRAHLAAGGTAPTHPRPTSVTDDPAPEPPPLARHDPYAALRHRDFRWYIVSLFAMTLGSQLQAVVVGWQVYAITHDPLSLGLIGLAEALPFIAIALPAGYLADRRNRRSISVAALFVLACCSRRAASRSARCPACSRASA